MLLRLGRWMAVALPQPFTRAGLARIQRLLARIGVEVPRDVVPPLVARELGAGVRLLEPLRQVVVEPAVGAAVARGLGREGVPLQHALRVREAAVVFGDLGRGAEEDLGLAVRELRFAALHLGRQVPWRTRLGS